MIASFLDWQVGSPGGLAIVTGMWAAIFGGAYLRTRRRR